MQAHTDARVVSISSSQRTCARRSVLGRSRLRDSSLHAVLTKAVKPDLFGWDLYQTATSSSTFFASPSVLRGRMRTTTSLLHFGC